MELRSLKLIAQEIIRDWTPPAIPAQPYLNAMSRLNSIKDNYGIDPGYEIVMYFLSNAGSWKGEVARRIKLELKEHLKSIGIK
jgi:hypothetical protein